MHLHIVLLSLTFFVVIRQYLERKMSNDSVSQVEVITPNIMVLLATSSTRVRVLLARGIY
jgi:ribosomal protein S3